MVAPLILLLLSLAGVAAALTLPQFSDLILLAGPAAFASLLLLLLAYRALLGRKTWVVIDGSNVMHWKDRAADIGTLREVLLSLGEQGLHPKVIFDANAGYKLAGRYQHDQTFSRQLGLTRGQVKVVPKGTPADPLILAAARDLGARVVTNDRYCDWAETYPEVAKPGHLIRGGYRNGELWLDLP
jgi:hypothetical protein